MDSILRHVSAGALESVRSAILITEASGPDRPIVFVNAAFETLTGYSKDEVLGRDCRFLQNQDRAQIARQEIRYALVDQTSVRSILRNYRKDGSSFYNEIFINPIRDNVGNVTHFVGCQNAIDSPAVAGLRDEANGRLHTLSSREKELFEFTVRGYANKEIARMMNLSPRTVEKHRFRMQEKMGTKNLSLLIRYAIAMGYVFDDT